MPPLLSPASENEVAFSAESVEYDSVAETISARGDVRMARQGVQLRADQVSWNRATGEVTATGDVIVRTPEGDTAYGQEARLDDSLRDGAIENLLLVLEGGGRLVADGATRVDGVSTLENAAYTPCRVTDDAGCPKTPSWSISAVRIIHDPVRARISYRDARFTLFGITFLALPAFSHPDSSAGGSSGLLVPEFRISRTNGLEIAFPYYMQLADNRDLTLTPRVYSGVVPSIEAHYRHLASEGAFQVRGIATYGENRPINPPPGGIEDGDDGFRGYIEANGRFQFTPQWSATGSMRLTTDDTFLRRYDISRDDRLRQNVSVERIGVDSYLSIAGWAVQDLRFTGDSGQQPIAIPVIDWRLRAPEPWLGGNFMLQANTLGIVRTEGQDTQRAFASAEWQLRRITDWGQEVTFTALARADVYHSDENADTLTLLYAGDPGWQFRGIGAFAADMAWPFVGELFGGVQRITPRVQIAYTPPLSNLDVPNEDSRSIELEDTNIFALNRFPGYDRFEDGARVTYGGEYSLDLPGFAFDAVIGQSYRLTDKETLFPDGTGLAEQFSDVVGRTQLRYGRFVALTHRYRLDKDNLAFRRNEIDLAVGSTTTYGEIGYLRLNRDNDFTIEDLQDREELLAGARVAIGNYWSIFGSAVIDLTSEHEDPLSQSDGFEPVRTRIGIAYIDECIELGFTWRRDYDDIGDSQRGNTFLVRFALTNLGR
ncbi:MAG: LPS-assembly protein LptD [Sphingomonadaceae bacterium]|nr:LPS-assembly protein LptD [Sphingomonadaceae bacterium]